MPTAVELKAYFAIPMRIPFFFIAAFTSKCVQNIQNKKEMQFYTHISLRLHTHKNYVCGEWRAESWELEKKKNAFVMETKQLLYDMV